MIMFFEALIKTVSYTHLDVYKRQVKELPEEELNSGIENDEEKKYGLVQAFKLLVKNKYYRCV